MALEKRYSPDGFEPDLQKFWQKEGVYQINWESASPIYSIDSPPATVSGYLHLGHVYSYSHPDFMARFFRMRGYRVFYPMGFDDNGLPTERLVEKRLGISPWGTSREDFIKHCLQISEEAEADYKALWERLGLSIDWRYTYRTIDSLSRRTSQASFIDLFHKGFSYRQKAPALWCPTCRTAIAQADLEDHQRETEFVTLPFTLPESRILPIATTRPELLAACVAVFVNPQDKRYQPSVGAVARVPIYGQDVPVLTDEAVHLEEGSGAVMCCTFGDQTDVWWWRKYHLPYVQAIDAEGRMTPETGILAGLTIPEARQVIKRTLADKGLISDRKPTVGSVRVHDRCETPVETIITEQWFIKTLEYRDTLLIAGEQIEWHPESMQSRYRSWVENLSWDWCISRQRLFGVPFPVWYCKACGEVLLAEPEQLPIDPTTTAPIKPCRCGSYDFTPETDVMDTWATSSLSPQIITRWQSDPDFFNLLFPMTMRPQAHEIIRTWAFYTILKSLHHFDRLPWKHVLISGWGIAGEGMGKISKSHGGGPMPPFEMIRRYSADAVRYWAASTGPGKDSVISEEKIQAGSRLVTKLWNVARFSEPFIAGFAPAGDIQNLALTPADQWIVARTGKIIATATNYFEAYEFAAAKNEIENYFWRDICDNYIEMVKQRLYNQASPTYAAACSVLGFLLWAVTRLFAPILPYVSEAIYQELFRETIYIKSIHLCSWPSMDEFPWQINDLNIEAFGEKLIAIATAVRRFKSEQNLSLGSELHRLQLAESDPAQVDLLRASVEDLTSICRAGTIEIIDQVEPSLIRLTSEPPIVAVEL